MVDERKNFNIYKGSRKITLKLGDVVELTPDTYPINFSQSDIKKGLYYLDKVDLNNIDVVKKGINIREFFNWDGKYNWEYLKDNINNTSPVILERMNGTHYSVDGHHRITVASELGWENISAFVIEVDELSYPRS